MSKIKASFYFIMIALLVLAACAPAASDSSANTTVAAESQTIIMNPLGTLSAGEVSQVTGSAQVTALDNGNLQIVVTLNNLESNSSHMGHIHVGDCSVVGPVATGLNAIEADASGTGSSTTEVPASSIPSPAYIAYHQRGPTDPAGVGGFISCGDIK